MKTVKIINRTTGETEFVYFGNVTAAMAYYAEGVQSRTWNRRPDQAEGRNNVLRRTKP